MTLMEAITFHLRALLNLIESDPSHERHESPRSSGRAPRPSGALPPSGALAPSEIYDAYERSLLQDQWSQRLPPHHRQAPNRQRGDIYHRDPYPSASSPYFVPLPGGTPPQNERRYPGRQTESPHYFGSGSLSEQYQHYRPQENTQRDVRNPSDSKRDLQQLREVIEHANTYRLG